MNILVFFIINFTGTILFKEIAGENVVSSVF